MADLNDILTAQKNGVVAINTLNQTWQGYSRKEYGDTTSACVTAATLIATGSGYITTVSVVAKGTATGVIYNSASPNSKDDGSRLLAILEDVGVYRADCRFTNGLLVVPGAGQAVTVTYSLD